MQFTTALISLATLATISSANPVPQSYPGANNWGYWNVTGLTITTTPAVPDKTYQFNVQYYSQTLKATCYGPVGNIRCSDSSYSVTSPEGKPFTITQKLYQTGAIAVLSGNGTLNTRCLASDGATKATTKIVCTAPTFKVDAKLVNTILP